MTVALDAFKDVEAAELAVVGGVVVVVFRRSTFRRMWKRREEGSELRPRSGSRQVPSQSNHS